MIDWQDVSQCEVLIPCIDETGGSPITRGGRGGRGSLLRLPAERDISKSSHYEGKAQSIQMWQEETPRRISLA